LVCHIVETLRSAGATEEMIALVKSVSGTFEGVPRSKGGRPRKHADDAAKFRAFRARKRARNEISNETPEYHPEYDRAERRAARLGNETSNETGVELGASERITNVITVRRNETDARNETSNETHVETDPGFAVESAEYLRTRLLAHGNFDLSASIEPIRMLIAQGCDLERDILPVVASRVPELPRPLKNWGAHGSRATSWRPETCGSAAILR
jgi:hypothetical protein